MKLLVWHWGRRGAGPLFAARLAQGLAAEGAQVTLSLAAGAELLTQDKNLVCGWQEPTYDGAFGYAMQRLALPFANRRILGKLLGMKPDFAICAMPALLDQRMIRVLRRCKVPYGVIVHDAAAHPGDGLRFRMLDQPHLLRDAAALFPLSSHVEAALRRQGFGRDGHIEKLWHPPFFFREMQPAFSHGGRKRLLCFGRLLPYKGLDLLADALTALGPEPGFDVKICGGGPVSAELSRLRALPGVQVDHRWIGEAELPDLLEWSDAVILPYREASQSGVAAAAIGQGRVVVVTKVGGLPEQLAGHPGAILCDPSPAGIAEALQAIKPIELHGSAASAAANWRLLAGKAMAAAQNPALKR